MTTPEQPEPPVDITFLMFTKPLDDDKFALMRFANGVPVHYMGSTGMWVAFSPDDDQATEEFLEMVDSEDWPIWEHGWEEDDDKVEAQV